MRTPFIFTYSMHCRWIYIRDSCAVHFHFMSTQHTQPSDLLNFFFYFFSVAVFLHLLPFTLHYAFSVGLSAVFCHCTVRTFDSRRLPLLHSSTRKHTDCTTNEKKSRQRKSEKESRGVERTPFACHPHSPV